MRFCFSRVGDSLGKVQSSKPWSGWKISECKHQTYPSHQLWQRCAGESDGRVNEKGRRHFHSPISSESERTQKEQHAAGGELWSARLHIVSWAAGLLFSALRRAREKWSGAHALQKLDLLVLRGNSICSRRPHTRTHNKWLPAAPTSRTVSRITLAKSRNNLSKYLDQSILKC